MTAAVGAALLPVLSGAAVYSNGSKTTTFDVTLTIIADCTIAASPLSFGGSQGVLAAAVNSSAFYFCKMFKQATGLTFTDYLARTRIEKVKNLLLNPHKRISEVAYETGFQSLSQFNRVFRRITGQAPTVWRAKLPRQS